MHNMNKGKRIKTESTPMSFNGGGQSRRQALANADDESLIDWDQSSAEMQRLKQM